MPSLEKAKEVLDRNQYPPDFYEPIIRDTINKVQAQQQQPQPQPQQQTAPPEQTGQQPETTESPKHCFLVQYRGVATDQLVRSLYEANAPIQAVVTLRKIRTFVSQLKAKVPEEIASRVIYQITCPSCGACYVGQTCRHARASTASTASTGQNQKNR